MHGYFRAHLQDSLFPDVLKGFKRPIGDGPETQLQELRELTLNAGGLNRVKTGAFSGLQVQCAVYGTSQALVEATTWAL